jgi:hypothetical protein
MSDPNEIIIGNITEAYRRIDRLTAISLASSVWLLIVSLTNPTLSENKPTPKLPLPFDLTADVPTVWLALIALAAYVTSGTLIALYYRTSRRAIERLDLRLSDAVQTFPSIATLPRVPRLVSFLALGGLGMLAIVLMYRTPGDSWKGLSAGIILASPYVVLFIDAFASEARRQARELRKRKEIDKANL